MLAQDHARAAACAGCGLTVAPADVDPRATYARVADRWRSAVDAGDRFRREMFVSDVATHTWLVRANPAAPRGIDLLCPSCALPVRGRMDDEARLDLRSVAAHGLRAETRRGVPYPEGD